MDKVEKIKNVEKSKLLRILTLELPLLILTSKRSISDLNSKIFHIPKRYYAGAASFGFP